MSASVRGVAGVYAWLCCAIAPCFLLSDLEAWPFGTDALAGSVAGLQTVLLSLASAGVTALLALPCVWLVGRAASLLLGRLSPAAQSGLVALALFVAVAASAWFFFWPDVRQALHPDRAMCLLAGAAAGLIGYVDCRLRDGSPRGTRGAVAFSLMVALVVAGLHVSLDPRKYIELHDLAELLMVIAIGAASSGAVRGGPNPGWARWAPLGLLPLVASLALAPSWNRADAPFRAVGAQNNRLARRISGLASVLGDRDGDGHAAWIYPGDCDDRDAAVHPGAPERRDGRDANCNGQRLTLDAALAAPRQELASPTGGDVLLVSIDALVPAALSHMPRLSELARAGVELRRCYAGGTATALSLPLFFRPDDSTPPVTDALARKGVLVEAWLDRISFPDILAARRVESSDLAIQGFLLALGSPEPRLRLSWVHLFDLHEPGETTTVSGGTAPGSGAERISPAYARAARNLDEKLARLMRELRASERGRGTRLIITGDHGEAFGEHGFTAHGFSGYEEVVRTPCILLGPAIPPRVYDGLSSHRGLPATLLALFGLHDAAVGAEQLADSWLRVLEPGRPLRPFALVRSMRHASGGIGHHPLAIMVSGQFKLVEGVGDGSLELYDLLADPGEHTNLAARSSGELPALRARLGELVDADGFPSPATYAYRNFLFRVTGDR